MELSIVQPFNVGLYILRYLMRFPALLFGLFLSVFAAVAQEATLPKQPRILILLDGSARMLQPWEKGEQRF